MIVVGDIVEIVGGYDNRFNGQTGEVLRVGSILYDVRLSEYECLSFWHREVRPTKEHKVLQILRTWRDSR